MSHIDSYEHEYLGAFGYLPIYRALKSFGEETPWGDYDFGADPDSLILGGGSGEHPGLVVHELASCVAQFLYHQADDDFKEELDDDEYQYLRTFIFRQNSDILEFCEWPLDKYVDFGEMLRSDRMVTPYDEESDVEGMMEDWLIRNMGEFVYYSLPDLNPEHDKLKAMFKGIEIRPLYENVVCPPPGYPPRGGKIDIDGEVKWGYHRWFS